MSAKFTKEVEIELGAEALATLFCELGSDEQAEFFEVVAQLMANLGTFRGQTQTLYIAQGLRGTKAETWLTELCEALPEAP